MQDRAVDEGRAAGLPRASDIAGPPGAAQLLRDTEAKLRAVIEEAPLAMALTGKSGEILFRNPRFDLLWGRPPHVTTARTYSEVYEGYHLDGRPIASEEWPGARALLKGEVIDNDVYEIVQQGGRRIACWFGAAPIRDASGEIAGAVVVFRDVSEEMRTEARLRDLNDTLERRVAEALAEKKLLADLIEGTDAFVQVAGLDYTWLAINRAAADEFERIFGVRPRVGDNMLDLLADRPEHQAALRAVWSRALAGEEFTEVGEFGDPALDRRSYEMKYNTLRDEQGRRIGAYQFVYDVTARVRDQQRLAEAETALRQSQKMEAMGQLTGGVAHDFNNLLTPIIGVLDMLQRQGLGGEREQRLIAGAVQSADRARTLVQRLLAFARRQPLQSAPLDLARLVRDMGDLVASTTGPQVQVVVDAPEGLPPAWGDANQLEMALLNLAVNARDAMPHGGVLRISVGPEEVRAGHRSALPPGPYLRVSVADSGVGMDGPTLARAIEPFFSTKGIGKGTGLGLSMVHGLASQLGGALTIQSRVGLGTNVELWLPRSAAAAGVAPPPAEPAPEHRGRGTALLVDDEDLVRAATADMLHDLGYAVTEAGSAAEALTVLDGGAAIDLVITDHLMPGLSGVDLARAVRARQPSVPVLLVSGYADLDGIDPDLPALSKPFRQDELAAALAQL